MKNKRIVFILLPVTLLIWVIIGYRIYSSLNKEPTFQEIIAGKKSPPENNISIENFAIVGNYIDPFLKGNVAKNNGRGKTAIIPSPQKGTTAQWPTIKYGGLIRKQQSNRQFAMISINGKDRIMKVNDCLEEVCLNKIYNDSIEMIFKGVKKHFTK